MRRLLLLAAILRRVAADSINYLEFYKAIITCLLRKAFLFIATRETKKRGFLLMEIFDTF